MANTCYHCTASIPKEVNIQLDILGESRALCCQGCEAVASAIIQSGGESFYKFRTDKSETPEFNPNALPTTLLQELELYDNPDVLVDIAHKNNDIPANTYNISLIIEGISCAACSWLIEKQLKQFSGVKSVGLNLSQHRLQLSWSQDETQLSKIISRIYALGFKAHPYTPDLAQKKLAAEQKKAMQRLTLAAFGTMQAMMFALPLYVGDWGGIFEKFETYFRFASLIITTPVVLFSARPFFMAFWRDMKTRHLTMDVPVAIAVGCAYVASIWSTFTHGEHVYFDSVCMFTFFLLVGRYLETRARVQNGEAGNQLDNLLPRSCLKIDSDGNELIIPVKQLKLGDRVRILPGATICVDGRIIEGQSNIDESIITGEFLPIHKSSGDTVIGGSLNVENPLLVEVTALDKTMQISTIMSLLDQAAQDKPKIAKLADEIAQYFVAAVLVLSALVFTSWYFIDADKAFWITLSVLVATCPCALSLATPTALTAATNALRRQGILITRSHVLESLKDSKRFIFDKTGTLTLGKLSIESVQVLQGTKKQALKIAASLEAHSNHPIAHAFSHENLLSVAKINNQSGQGISGNIDGHEYKIGLMNFACPNASKESLEQPKQGHWILLSKDHIPMAWFLLNDELRNDAVTTIKELKDLGFNTEILSGDHSDQVNILAAQLHIDQVHGGISPAGKLEYVAQLNKQDMSIMVGDGINDVPVLAAAPISIAMNNASDLAKTHADVILMNAHLNRLPMLIKQARRCRRIIRQNLIWALLYNGSVLPLAACGLLPPYAAAIGMSTSSLVVVFNALRLNKIRP